MCRFCSDGVANCLQTKDVLEFNMIAGSTILTLIGHLKAFDYDQTAVFKRVMPMAELEIFYGTARGEAFKSTVNACPQN